MVTISEALKMYTKGKYANVDPIDQPVHQLIADTLFRIANQPNTKKRGSLRRATNAQKLILDRMVGKRLPGTNPAAVKDTAIDFVDLTVSGEIDGGPQN